MRFLASIQLPDEFTRLRYRCLVRCHDSVKGISANIPHCTLMVVNALSSRQRAIMESLGRIPFTPLSLELGGPDVFPERGKDCSLVAKINLGEPLQDLHLRVAEAMKPFIDWSQTPKWQDYPQFQGDEARREDYMEYGSPFFGQFYNPHVSLASLKGDSLPQDLSEYFPLRDYRFDAGNFALSRKTEGLGWDYIQGFRARLF